MEQAIEWAKTGVIEPPPTTKIAKLEDLPGEEVMTKWGKRRCAIFEIYKLHISLFLP